MELDVISTDLVKVTSSDWYNQSHSPESTHYNNTNVTTHFSRDEDIAVIEVAVSATILFLAIAGNSCVILSLAIKRKHLSRMHLMILHLSLADLFVAFFNVLPQLIWDVTYRFQGGPLLCVVVKYLQVVAMYASSYVLLATAVDRYYAICRPFLSQSWTAKQAHILVIIAWTASLLFSLPQMFIFSYREVELGSEVYDCWAKFHPDWTLPAYITWMTTSIFIVPTCLLGLLYGQITWVVWKAGRLEQKMLPAKFTALGHRQDSIYRSRNEAATDFQSPTYNNVRCADVAVGQGKQDGAFFNCTASDDETAKDAVLDTERVFKFGNYTNISRAGSVVEFNAAGPSNSTGLDQRVASKTRLSEHLNNKLSAPLVSQVEQQGYLEDQQIAATDTNLPGVFQSTVDNSKKKCQHRSEDPTNPPAQSYTHPSLIMETVRIRKNCNETNLDKHNQNQYRDLIVSCDSRCSHISESCHVLNEQVQETGKRLDAGSCLIYPCHDVYPLIIRPAQKETVKDGTKFCPDFASGDDVKTLLVGNEVSNLPRDYISCPLSGVYMDNETTPSRDFCRVNSNLDLVLEDKSTTCALDSVNYMTVEELCPRNELCRIKRANFAFFRHSAYDAVLESQNNFLKQERVNLCSHSCNSLMAGSQLHAGYDSIQSRPAIKSGIPNTSWTQPYSKVASETNLKDLVISEKHDTFDGDHQSCTEDTVSTLGSLASLKLFDTTESSRHELSVSSEEMTCQYALLTSANLAHSCTLSASCGSQAPQEGLCSSGATSKSLLSQGGQGHHWERHSPPVCNATASLGGSSDAFNCVQGDQRRRSLQPGKFSISRAKLKTIKLTLTVVICYIVCWAPFFVGQMWAAYDINAPYDGPFFSIIMLLASINSCTNPWIYTIFSNTICQKIQYIFGTPCRCFAACWKAARSHWSGKGPPTSVYLQSTHAATKKRIILEKNSFSTVG